MPKRALAKDENLALETSKDSQPMFPVTLSPRPGHSSILAKSIKFGGIVAHGHMKVQLESLGQDCVSNALHASVHRDADKSIFGTCLSHCPQLPFVRQGCCVYFTPLSPCLVCCTADRSNLPDSMANKCLHRGVNAFFRLWHIDATSQESLPLPHGPSLALPWRRTATLTAVCMLRGKLLKPSQTSDTT